MNRLKSAIRDPLRQAQGLELAETAQSAILPIPDPQLFLASRLSLKDKGVMEQSSGASGNPQFRSDVPAYSAPDRGAWVKKHGLQPYELDDIPTKYFTRARGAVARDSETIAFERAVNAWVNMDSINMAVGNLFEFEETTLVFFDPQTDSFWAYPSSEQA